MKKRIPLILLTTLLAISLLAGCSSSTDNSGAASPSASPAAAQESSAFQGEYVVNADYVKSNASNIILVDARGDDAANEGTIEGAIVTTWQNLAAVENGKAGDANWGIMLDAEALSAKLSALGLIKDKEIVVFSTADKGWGEDGRIVWELLAAGYTDVKMVDGGFTALQNAGLNVIKGGTAPTPATVTIDSLDETHDINTDELAADYAQYKVIDVRADDEFNGKVLYGEANGGHLPGAIHIKYTDLFNSDSTLKSNSEITSMLDAAGISKTDKIVTYCTKGIRSAYMELVLEMCGYENVKNYDESYYRWCAVNTVE